MAQRLVSDGYLAVGYNQISIDDCWESKTRDAQGRLVPDSTRFPSGFKALGDFMHSLKVKFGIYSDMGTKTCGGYPGSEGYEQVDAQTFAEWGVDYLKLDGCYNNQGGYNTGYPLMGSVLQASGRNITYSCSWPAYLGNNETAKPFDAFIAAGCNLWRNWDDIDNTWSSIVSIMDHFGNYSIGLQASAGPGHWHDMDMIVGGSDHLGTILPPAQARAQLAIWSIMASPLIMSNDLRTVPTQHRQILQNEEVIAINQDRLGKAGTRISHIGAQEVWARELHNGAVAVALLNKLGTTEEQITVNFADLGIDSVAIVRDLFVGQDLGSFIGNFTATVEPTGVVMIKVETRCESAKV